MKNYLHFLLLPLLLGLVQAVDASVVTIDMTAQGYSNSQSVNGVSITSGDATVTFSKGSGSTAPAYYTTGTAVRIYGGNTLTISAGEEMNIKKIVMTFASGSSYQPSNETFSVNTGSATTGATTTWTGEGENIVITHNATSGHWRLKTMQITIESTETAVAVSSLRDLRALSNGTLAELTLGRDNQGLIEWVYEGDDTYAFVRDNNSAVRFTNFLPDDRGWHTVRGGALIGTVKGIYKLNQGMPEFTVKPSGPHRSMADSILCLDNWHTPTPLVKLLAELDNRTYRANYVKVQEVSIFEEDGYYYMEQGDHELPMSDPFGINAQLPTNLEGRSYNIEGILGVTEDGLNSELYITSVEEIIPTLALAEDAYTNLININNYDGRLVNVTLSRQMVTDTWNTLCLPFDIFDFSSIVSSSRLAEFSGYDAATNTLEFNSVENLTAGLPYLVYPEEDIDDIVIQGALINSELTPVTYGTYDMVGIFTPTTLYAGDRSVLFLGNNNTLYHPSVTNDLKAFRAYFKTATEQSANICIDGIVSDIHSAELDQPVNGGPLYNISGQFVGSSLERLPKGVYVSSGNKVIIK